MLTLSQSNGDGGCACACKCHALFGDNLDVVISGYSDCGCFDVNNPDPGPKSGQVIDKTGIEGIFTAAWNGTFWEVEIGTVKIQLYQETIFGPDGCTTPVGDPISFTLRIAITCSGNNVLSANIATTTIPPDSSFSSFIFIGSGSINIPISNTIDCIDQQFAKVDVVTLSHP